jgi:cytochrome c peroxidase
VSVLPGSRPARSLASFALACLLSGASAAIHDHPAPTVLAPGYSDLEFTPPPAGTYALPPLGVAADGAVLNTAGEPRRLHDYLGDKIVVLSFIYTTCSDVNGCPLAAFVLTRVQNRVLQAPTLANRVRLLSFSFDPDHDTPEVLETYSRNFRNPAFDWQFLTTASRDTLDPTLLAYGQWVVRDYDEQGNFLGTMSHLLRVFLIDTSGRIRNIYSTSFLHADTIANDIETLIRETE